MNDSDQNNELKFGEKKNYHQIGNAYLQYEMTTEKGVAIAANRVLIVGVVNRLTNKAFAFCFKEARLSTTRGSDTEHDKDCGQVSTITRALTSQDGGLLSHFDKIDESEAEIENNSLNFIFLATTTQQQIKVKLKDNYLLNIYFGFARLLKILLNI